MTSEQVVQIQVDRAATRLDQFLAETIPNLSRSQIQKLIRQGRVFLAASGGQEPRQVKRPSTQVQPGNVLTLPVISSPPKALRAEIIPLDIIFEDNDLVVINKPAGLVVHPAHGHPAGTLVNALLARYPDLVAMTGIGADTLDRPGIVHRLDRDTSGLMVVARTPEALLHLRRQFKSRAVEKKYLALVFGCPEATEGIIDVPLGRDPRHRQKFAPRADGKPARTHYRLRADFGRYSLLEIGLETGRTHQIRVHLAWFKCPVVGDAVYGRKKNPLGLQRQFLHAWRLGFEHPRSGEILHLEAPLPGDLQKVLADLGGG
ncbi:MAG: RluA family pseudouridine synthase [Anaerolineae bacterium]|nr:RluA family pseudouridine synthase [Anaerolineae bacterium]